MVIKVGLFLQRTIFYRLINYFQLLILLQLSIQMSTIEFIRKVKLHNDKQLLLTGNYKVAEVAFMIGTDSITYFRQ